MQLLRFIVTSVLELILPALTASVHLIYFGFEGNDHKFFPWPQCEPLGTFIFLGCSLVSVEHPIPW